MTFTQNLYTNNNIILGISVEMYNCGKCSQYCCFYVLQYEQRQL